MVSRWYNWSSKRSGELLLCWNGLLQDIYRISKSSVGDLSLSAPVARAENPPNWTLPEPSTPVSAQKQALLVRFLLEKATNHKTAEANPRQPPSGRTYQFSSKSVTSSYNFWLQNLFRSKALCNSYHDFNCEPYGPKLLQYAILPNDMEFAPWNI